MTLTPPGRTVAAARMPRPLPVSLHCRSRIIMTRIPGASNLNRRFRRRGGAALTAHGHGVQGHCDGYEPMTVPVAWTRDTGWPGPPPGGPAGNSTSMAHLHRAGPWHTRLLLESSHGRTARAAGLAGPIISAGRRPPAGRPASRWRSSSRPCQGQVGPVPAPAPADAGEVSDSRARDS